MYSKEQILKGCIAYIDNEIMPNVPTYAKWIVGTYVTTMSLDNAKIDELFHHPLVETLGIEHNGLYDVDTLMNNLRTSARKYGKMELTFPMLGTMTFSEDDVNRLHNHIKGA